MSGVRCRATGCASWMPARARSCRRAMSACSKRTPHSVRPMRRPAGFAPTTWRVADAAVVGLADPRLGQVPAAAVVLRANAVVSVDALQAWVAERKPGYCVPEAVAFVDTLPRSAMFKLLSNEVRALIESDLGSAKS